MTTQLPAALASIKRYSMPEFGHDLREDKDGFLFYVKDVLAALPPPADGAIGFRVRLSKSDKWGVWQMGASPTASELAMFPIIQYAYAAPPADSAMELLQQALLSHDANADGWRYAAEYWSVRARAMLAGRK